MKEKDTMKEEYLVYWNAVQEVEAAPGRNGGHIWQRCQQSLSTEQEAVARYETLATDPSVTGLKLAYRRWLRDCNDDTRLDQSLFSAAPILGRIVSVEEKSLRVDNANVFFDDQPLNVIRDGEWLTSVRILMADGEHSDLYLVGGNPDGVRSGDLLSLA